MQISSGFIQSMNRSKCKIEIFNPNIITAKMKKWVWNLLFSLYITSFFLIYIQLFENHRTPFFTNIIIPKIPRINFFPIKYSDIWFCFVHLQRRLPPNNHRDGPDWCWFWIYRQWQDEILHIYTAFEFHLSKHGESGMEFGVQMRELKRNETV